MRRMITEKEADKLRIIKDDKVKGIISIDNEEYGDSEIVLDGDYIEIRSVEVQYIDPEDNQIYFIASHENGIYMDLPIQDPHQKNKLWNDNGIVKISLG